VFGCWCVIECVGSIPIGGGGCIINGIGGAAWESNIGGPGGITIEAEPALTGIEPA